MLKDFAAGMQHVGVPTNDIDATIAFYKKLGFETAHETKADCRVCFLRLGNLMIETYENKQGAMKAGAIDHIALDCTDIEAAFAEAKREGFTLTADAIQGAPFWEKGVRFFKVVGPNKEIVEFCQIL